VFRLEFGLLANMPRKKIIVWLIVGVIADVVLALRVGGVMPPAVRDFGLSVLKRRPSLRRSPTAWHCTPFKGGRHG
jgi:hypothetical protein